MNKSRSGRFIAACLSAALVAGVGSCPVFAEDTETTSTSKIIFQEDFEGSEYDGLGNASGARFAFSESYNWFLDRDKVGERLMDNFLSVSYNYESSEGGNTVSYYNMSNLRWSMGKSGNDDRGRGIQMYPTAGKTDWYMDVKLTEYNGMAVGALAEKAIDVTLLYSFTTGTAKTTTTNPAYGQILFTVDGEEKSIDLGSEKLYTSAGGHFNGFHVRNKLAGILGLDGVQAYMEVSNVRFRFTGKVENVKYLKFDNIVVREDDPKVVFSEDFDVNPWFGTVKSTDFLQDVYAVDTIDDVAVDGKAFAMVAKQDNKYNHTMTFAIPNLDTTKCYKVKLDAYYPTTNSHKTDAEVWVRDKVVTSHYKTLKKISRNKGFETYEMVFDFSNTPEGITGASNLELMVKFGDGDYKKGDALYLDNITVTETSFKDISAVQGSNWFSDTNSLVNGDLKVMFRNTDEECKGVIAQYDAKGNLKGVDFVSVPTTEQGVKTITVDDSIDKVSLFLWNGDNIQPLTASKTLSKKAQ